MAAELEWMLCEDGCLCVNECVSSVTYHPTLNVLLVISKESTSVKVLDVCAGILLQNCGLSASFKSQVQCTYIPGHDKVLFTDGRSVGLRRDHNGVLLLDTILQTRVSSPSEVVRIELLLSEAAQLLRCLQETDLVGNDHSEEVWHELESKIAVSEAQSKGNHKVAKWCTVCLELPHCVLKSVFASLVQELKRLNRSVPSLSIASAISERLNSLLPASNSLEVDPNGVATVDRSLMFSESARRATFGKWPHMNYKWALPDQMAQAGFYHQWSSTGDDRAMCFTCSICLVCWEPTDEPWSEHERHSPSCPFVKGEYTQNVPLSITYATSPAIPHSDRLEKFSCISSSTCPDLIGTATASGNVVVWNVARGLKKEFQFTISPKDPLIVTAFSTRQKHHGTISGIEKKEGDAEEALNDQVKDLCQGFSEEKTLPVVEQHDRGDLAVTSLAILGPPETGVADGGAKEGEAFLGSPLSIMVGCSIQSPNVALLKSRFSAEENPLVQVMNDVNQTNCAVQSLDIMKMEEKENAASAPNPPRREVNNVAAGGTASGLFLLHCVFEWYQASRGVPVGSGSTAASGSGSSTKVASGSQREASRVLCPPLGMLLNDETLEGPYGISFVGTPSSLVQGNDLKFGVYSLEQASEDSAMSGSGGYYAGPNDSSVHPKTRTAKPERKDDQVCGRVARCIRLPGNFSGESYQVSHVVPTPGGQHVLVVVGLQEERQRQPSDDSSGALFLYALECQEDSVVVADSPTLQRTLREVEEVVTCVTVLPPEVKEAGYEVLAGMRLSHDGDSQFGPSGYVSVVTRGGCIRIIDLSTLESVGEMKSPVGTSFVGCTYCTSIERLCACTEHGNLHLLQLWPRVREVPGSNQQHLGPLPDVVDDGGATGLKKEQPDSQGVEDVLLVHRPLCLDILTKIHALTCFTNLTPRFAATLPACWTEIQQEQKQRRHPQHLQQHGESNQHTRSWRLQSDSSTWDEHLFEISLPKACCVGHIDFKFNLQSVVTTPPNIQVTLLKQNTSGIGKKEVRVSEAADVGIDLNLRLQGSATAMSASNHPASNASTENPVLRPEFLEAHNAEILCGPLSLSSCLDLSGQSGIVTFASPKLLRTKARTFLIHLKTLAGPIKEQNGKREATSRSIGAIHSSKPPHRWQNFVKPGPVPSLQSLLELYVPPGSAIELLASSGPNKKAEAPKGCDLFHEISITVRSAVKTDILNERLQRQALLTDRAFQERLISAVCSNEGLSVEMTLDHRQHLALDILNWIAAIQSNGTAEERNSCSIVSSVQASLHTLIRCCFLDAGRSVAHKCAKLIVFCLEFPKESSSSAFDCSLFEALLDWLPSVVTCRTAGAMRWFFLLLNRVKFLDGSGVGRACLALLVDVVHELNSRTDPLHALLRSRFGLYRTPLELQLFEIEAPLPPKSTSTPVTYATVVGNGGSGGGGSSSANNNNNGIAMGIGSGVAGVAGTCPTTASGVLNQANASSISEDGQGAFAPFSPPTQQLRGLLEVEPLHFTCHAASDGTKVEKIESGSSVGTGNPLSMAPNMTVYIPSANGTQQVSHCSLAYIFVDPKKSEEELLKALQYAKSNLHSPSNVASSSVPPKNTKDSFPASPGTIASLPVSPWQHFLQPPPQQALVIERMHSGARRFVVLDFGKRILLTDLMIPACPDLVSLSIDIWTEGEEIDGQRLVVSTDICMLSLVMNDLLPPPVCRFLKITAIGRYGMSTTRCRIPMGTFYGHTVLPPWLGLERLDSGEETALQQQIHLNVLSLLLEDIHCRYSLACDKLRSQLGPLLASDRPVSAHIQAFIQREQGKIGDEEQRVFSTYRDCVQLQQQFNLVAATVERLKRTFPVTSPVDAPNPISCEPSRSCTDKLRVLSELLLVTLLGMTYKPPPLPLSCLQEELDQSKCELLFRHLAIAGSNRFQAMANALLVRTCGLQPWWGQFISKMLVELYQSNQTAIFPQDRVFLLLVSCRDRALLHNTMPSILELLQKLLAPIADNEGFIQGSLDLSLISWVLLFVSFYMDIAESGTFQNANGDDVDGLTKSATLKERDRGGAPSRWDFIQEEWGMLLNQSSQNKTASSRLCRRKLHKRLMYHKQQLEDLEQVKKSYLPGSTYNTLKSHFGTKVAMDVDATVKQQEQLVKQQEQLVKKMIKQHTAKHFKDIAQIRRSEGASLSRSMAGESSSGVRDRPSTTRNARESAESKEPAFRLPRTQNLRVARGLLALLLSMDYTCNVDMFLLACKVLAKMTTLARPAIGLGEIIDQSQLDRLLFRCVGNQSCSGASSWGGPWASHAITCLLQDILEGERNHPIIRRSASDCSVGVDVVESISLPTPSSSVLMDLPQTTPTDADKCPVQFSNDANLPLLMKLLVVDSDDTSSDEVIVDSTDPFTAPAAKFNQYYSKKSWATTAKPSYFKNGSTSLLSSKESAVTPDPPSDLLPVPTVSAAMDARLEMGVDVGAEMRLKMMTFSEADVIFNSFFLPISPPMDGHGSRRPSPSSEPSSDPISPLQFSSCITSSSVDMLAICFDRLFQQACVPRIHLESLLHLWITLNEVASERAGANLSLSFGAASGILAALAWHPTVSLRTWHLAFTALQLPVGTRHANFDLSSPGLDSSAEHSGSMVTMARTIALDSNLLPVLVKFLSGSGLDNFSASKMTVGPTVSLAMYNFVSRLLHACNSLPSTCRTGVHLKEQLLRIIYILVANNGSIRSGQGPLDAQCRLVKLLLSVEFEGVDSNLQTSVVEAVSSLVHLLIRTGQSVVCRSSTESDVSDASCFGGVLSVLPRSDPSTAAIEATQSTLVHSLLLLCIRLVQSPLGETTPLPPQPSSPSPPPMVAAQHTDGDLTFLTDSLKMEQRTSGAPSANLSCRLRHAVPQTDEHKSAGSTAAASCSHSHALSPTPKQHYIADEVLRHYPTMMWFLHSLSACSGSTMAMLLGPMGIGSSVSGSDTSDKFFLGEPVSVGDILFQLLCTLNSKACTVTAVLQPILTFLSLGSAEAGFADARFSPSVAMSEPLLWLIMRILDCETAISEFVSLGGVQVICQNLVSSHRHQVNGQPTLLSVIVQKINRLMSPSSKGSWPTLESVDGLVNFAPRGVITLKDPNIQPADILIHPIPPHRRARTPAWSYHFYPEESWVDLTITLPCAVLLREVHIQPHLTSLATCPSAVALEIARESNGHLRPLGPPRPTSGLTFIRLQLSQPEVAVSVVVRLYKPRDSCNIGLSQILLLGTSPFGDVAPNARSAVASVVPTEESVAKSSVGWLRLLHHCLVQPCSTDTVQRMCAAATAVAGVLQTCCSLLLTPTPELYTTHIELVLLHLGRHNSQVGLQIIDTLLRLCSSPFGQGSWSHLIGSSQTSFATIDSVMDIVFLLCTTRDSGTCDRVYALLGWLLASAKRTLEQGQLNSGTSGASGMEEPHGIPAQAFIHCIAAILWSLYHSGFGPQLTEILNVSMLRLLYDWSISLPPQSNTRRAVDAVFTSMCLICPEYFDLLVEWMGFVPRPAASPYNFPEDEGPITDDSKQIGAQLPKDSVPTSSSRSDSVDFGTIRLDADLLQTLAAASQSPSAIERLIESGLPRFLAGSVLEFCLHEGTAWSSFTDGRHGKHMTDADKAGCSRDSCERSVISGETVTVILRFFTDVCEEGTMRDWLGGTEGSSFWLPLLDLLCLPLSASGCAPAAVHLSTQQRAALEGATVHFLERCCWCHPDNQQLLAQVLCEVIGKQASSTQGLAGNCGVLRSISGFARRLILQLFLETEKILVFVKSSVGLCNGRFVAPSSHTRHPRFGAGHRFCLLYASTQMTCMDIVKCVTGDAGTFPLASISERHDTSDQPARDLGSIGLELVGYLSVAAGVLAKDKRHKDAKNAASSRAASEAEAKIPSQSSTVNFGSLTSSSVELVHELFPDQPLPGQLTVAQLLTILEERGHSLGCPHLVLVLQQARKIRTEQPYDADNSTSKETLLNYQGFPSALQVFASFGGLALLAPYLPVLYPDVGRPPTQSKSNGGEKTVNDVGSAVDADWVKVEAPDDIFDDFPELLHPGTSTPRSSRNGQLLPTVPPHSLAAFGLFLQLPNYAETLLKERQKAQCLLRLALGVTDDGEGGDIFVSPVAASLPTLPFQVLQQLFDSMPLTTDDGVLLRRMALDVGAVHLLLACLSILSHQNVEVPLPGLNQELILSATMLGSQTSEMHTKSDDKSHLYWAKGTGFGTGSTTQSWDVEQAITKQKSEEEHVTCLLQVLASYINPRGTVPFDFFWLDDSEDEGIAVGGGSAGGNEGGSESGSVDAAGEDEGRSNHAQPLLPSVFPELLAQSCVFGTISSYLRNDSVLDMARHVPLYRALLQLLRAMAVSSQLVGLLLPSIGKRSTDGSTSSGSNSSDSSHLSICCLLTKMKGCVDTYASRLRTNMAKEGVGGGSTGKCSIKTMSKTKEEEESEGLALLIPDVQETARIVETATARLLWENGESNEDSTEGGHEPAECPPIERHLQKTLEERYLEVVKQLQFDTFEMIVEDDDGIRFTVPHHFESNMRAAGEHSHPSRARRLAQEAVTLSTSLPLSYSSTVCVRCDQDRLDLMKVLITGPAETPYANGCFEFDVYFPPDYPNSPMLINLETTGHHTVRFNPNLYNDGKVCLSILNTWHGRPEEKWNPQTSSFLQVLVSIQSLILVQEPYFNEPGYERSRGTPSGQQSSREYDSNIRQATVKWAMLEQLRNTCSCFKEMIQKHFWIKRAEIMEQCQAWICEMETQGSDRRTGRTVAVNCQALKRHFAQLKEEFSRMKPPTGLEDLVDTIDWQAGNLRGGNNEVPNVDETSTLAAFHFEPDGAESTAPDVVPLATSAVDESTPTNDDDLTPTHSPQGTSLFCGPI